MGSICSCYERKNLVEKPPKKGKLSPRTFPIEIKSQEKKNSKEVDEKQSDFFQYEFEFTMKTSVSCEKITNEKAAKEEKNCGKPIISEENTLQNEQKIKTIDCQKTCEQIERFSEKTQNSNSFLTATARKHESLKKIEIASSTETSPKKSFLKTPLFTKFPIHIHNRTEILADKSAIPLEFTEKSADNLLILEKVRENLYSYTQRAFDCGRKKYVILLTFRLISEEIREFFLLQSYIYARIQAISQENGANFLEYYGSFQENPTKNAHFLHTMVIEDGFITLEDLLKSGKSFENGEIMRFFLSLVRQLAILQRNGIAHRDISPKNIVLSPNLYDFRYKIANFSSACLLKPNEKAIKDSNFLHNIAKSSSFHQDFHAPELFLNKNCEYNPFVADVYSLGMVLLKLIDYFHGKKDVETGILSDKLFGEKYPNLNNFLKEMLEENPGKRVDFLELERKLLEIAEHCDVARDFQGNYQEIARLWKIQKNQQENKRKLTKNGLLALYRENSQLYQVFHAFAQDPLHFSQFFLEKAWFFLQTLKTQAKISENPNKTIKNRQFPNKNCENLDKFLDNFQREELFCAYNLAFLYFTRENYARSKEFLDIFQRSLENLHETLQDFPANAGLCAEFQEKAAECEFFLGKIAMKSGDFEQSSRFFAKYLQKIDKNSEFLCERLDEIAEFYYENFDFSKAKANFRRSLRLKQEKYEKTSAEILSSYENLAKLYKSLGKFAKSLKYTQNIVKSLPNSQQFALEIAKKLHETAHLHEKLGNSSKALEFYAKSQKMLEETPDFSQNFAYAELLAGFARFYWTNGEINKAKPLIFSSHSQKKRLFARLSPEIAASLENLGDFYAETGDFRKSERKYEKSLGIRERLSGENSANAQISYQKLGELHETTGNLLKSLAFLLKICENPHKSFTLSSSLALSGLIYAKIGDFSKAEAFLQASLAKNQEIYAKPHYNLANSYNSLGVFYEKTGNYAKSEENYLKALEIRTEILGEFHGDLLVSYDNLGELYELMGDSLKSEQFFRKSSKNSRQIFGNAHPNTAQTYNTLAVFYGKVGKFAKAEKFHGKALEIQKNCFGESSEEVALSLNNLALLYEKMEDLSKSQEHLRKACEIFKEIYGEKHVFVANLQRKLGEMYGKSGSFQRSIESFVEAREIFKQIHGENHQEIAEICLDLASIFTEIREFSKAIDNYHETLRIQEALHGKSSKEVAQTLTIFASFLEELGETAQSLATFSKALEIYREIAGDCAETAGILNNIAELHCKLHEFAEAERFYKESLRIREAQLGENHKETAQSYNNLGLLYKNTGDLAKAEHFYLKAEAISVRISGEKHQDTATSYNNLAGLYLHKGNREKARGYYLKALEIVREIYGENDVNTALVCNNLGALFAKEENMQMAKEFGAKAYEIYANIYGKEHQMTKIILSNLESYK